MQMDQGNEFKAVPLGSLDLLSLSLSLYARVWLIVSLSVVIIELEDEPRNVRRVTRQRQVDEKLTGKVHLLDV